jgi:hypothetical protein
VLDGSTATGLHYFAEAYRHSAPLPCELLVRRNPVRMAAASGKLTSYLLVDLFKSDLTTGWKLCRTRLPKRPNYGRAQ